MDFAVPTDHGVKLTGSKKRDMYLDLARELKITVEHESDVVINCNWCALYIHQRIGLGTGQLGNKRTSGDHLNYSIIKIGYNGVMVIVVGIGHDDSSSNPGRD